MMSGSVMMATVSQIAGSVTTGMTVVPMKMKLDVLVNLFTGYQSLSSMLFPKF